MGTFSLFEPEVDPPLSGRIVIESVSRIASVVGRVEETDGSAMVD